ncbi:hypothetical protein ITJ86_03390 [Winogradskyella sp. F6397]|uniref:Uncharacterized protein n=1 Tax=Winogradskyella marina TaxID=2785530 RepID=A0ABS0EEQ1_9FLAO|nr:MULTISPECIES: hypothetical protein [Winogradskyella]MBF8148924.1 hypothetical protein [Winogradskyella marina]
MKKIFKSILVLTVLLGTCTSFANTIEEVPPSATMVSIGDFISVSDVYGEVVYSGRINHNGFMESLYDFSQLENGTYTVEVNKDFEIEVNSVKVQNHIVTFLDTTKQKIFKPVFRSNASQVIISKLAIDTKEMVVELYFKNELIHTETVKGNEILTRVYQLDETQKGNYTAIIRANDRVFVENFKI